MNEIDVCVIGASNVDLISYVSRLPSLGETLHGSQFKMGFGGKGANQAVMAARLGGNVSLITKLGRDVFGEKTLANLKDAGVDTAFVFFTDQAFSGVAPIFVDENGDNSIVIVTGANDLLTEKEIHSASETIQKSKIFVCQLEIPVDLSLMALKIAKSAGVFSIVNPAPARENLPMELYEFSDLMCPNENETELMTRIKVNTIEDAQRAAREIVQRGSAAALITMGAKGSYYYSKLEEYYVPAPKVTALDTTGAGDAFIGSLSYFMGKGFHVQEAMIRANYVASRSVQSSGTQSSFPSWKDLPPEIIR